MTPRSTPRGSVALALVGVMGLAAAAVHGQTQSPATPPVFTASANLARLDVQVVDANGHPIPDLGANEIRVVEGGTPRPVLLLQHVADAGRSYAESAMRTIAAEVSTNQGAPRGQLYVLLFDQEHITPGAEQRVRLAAETFIRNRIRPEDRVAIFGIPQPGPALTFTNNTRNAIEQLQSIRGGMSRLNAGLQLEMTDYEAFAIQRGNEEVLNRFLIPSAEGTTSRAAALADVTSTRRGGGETPETLKRLVLESAKIVATKADGDSRRFLQTTAEVLRGLRAVDGRKNVLLFSEGFFGDNLAPELRNVAAAAAEVYAVVYAFDLNDRVTNMSEEARGADAAADALARTETIGGIAADTDGRLVTDALRRLDTALGEIVAPGNDYYMVGFEPSTDALADRTAYRRVQVTVTRPGAVVRTRTGYSVGADERSSSLPSVRRMTIDNALAAPFGQQGLRVEYTTYETRGSAGAERVVLSLETELPVAVDGADRADVVFVVRNARTGQVAASGADTLPLPTAPVAGRSTGTSDWRVQFSLPAGDYLMRCIVREPGGLLGSADRQFSVRSLGGPDVAASDLLLGKPGRQLPVRAVAFTAEPIPGTVRIYGRTAEQLDAVTARLELLSLDTNAAVVGVSGVPAETRDVDGQILRDIFFELPTAAVPPGDYVARAEIRARGELVSELRRQITVTEGAAPAAPAASAPAAPAPAAPEPRDAATGDIAQALVSAAATSASPVVRQAADGVSLLKNARYADAVSTLDAAFDANPPAEQRAAIAFLLGWAERGAGNLTKAVSAFRNAALADPSMIPVHLALADTYLQLQQPALAVQALEAGLASQPNAIELKLMLERIKK
jgi:VWFA-related protein